MTDKKFSEMPQLSAEELDLNEDFIPIVDADESVVSQKNKRIILSNLLPNQGLDTTDSPSFQGLLINGVPIEEYLGVVVAQDNLNASEAPTENDDETEGYSVGSKWYKTASPAAVYICLDATEGAAVWAESSLSIEDLGTAATKNIGSSGATVPTLDQRNFHQGVGFTLASSGNSSTIDLSQGDYHVRTIDDDTQFTFINVPENPTRFSLKVHTVGSPVITWANQHRTIDPVAPIADATHFFIIDTDDGDTFDIIPTWNMYNPSPEPPADYKLSAIIRASGPSFFLLPVEEDQFTTPITYTDSLSTQGNYLAVKNTGIRWVACNNNGNFRFYRIDTDGFGDEIIPNPGWSSGDRMAWSHDGLYIARATATQLIVYNWNDVSGLGSIVAQADLPLLTASSVTITDIAWNKQDTRIAVAFYRLSGLEGPFCACNINTGSGTITNMALAPVSFRNMANSPSWVFAHKITWAESGAAVLVGLAPTGLTNISNAGCWRVNYTTSFSSPQHFGPVPTVQGDVYYPVAYDKYLVLLSFNGPVRIGTYATSSWSEEATYDLSSVLSQSGDNWGDYIVIHTSTSIKLLKYNEGTGDIDLLDEYNTSGLGSYSAKFIFPSEEE